MSVHHVKVGQFFSGKEMTGATCPRRPFCTTSLYRALSMDLAVRSVKPPVLSYWDVKVTI